MSDPIHQKISQFLDDDLNQLESLQLLNALQQQPHLQSTMQRYLLINQALKSRPVLAASEGFVAQIQQKLEQEPVYFLPRQSRISPPFFKKAALALAASVAAVAIILPVGMRVISINHTGVLNLAQQQAVKSTKQALLGAHPSDAGLLVSNNSGSSMRMYPVNQRFQDYLQAHNGSLYTTNGVENLQYRAQLASYGKGE
ncbi:MAG: sigma-E factor negative regulatory protein [Methylococcales bacterium]